jgi:hypothetical protein
MYIDLFSLWLLRFVRYYDSSINRKRRIGDLEDILYFVLEEKYDERDFRLRRLRGKDRDAVHLFQCCVFLDVHLAVVTQTVTTIRAVQDSSAEKYLCDCHEIAR